MNKILLPAAITLLLLSGCRKEAPAVALPPASETATPVEAATTTDADDATTPEATPATAVASEAGVGPAGTDDKLINAAIDTVLGDHRKYQVVINAYQKAVAAGDSNAVAALIRYPLEVTIDGRKTSIQEAAGFVQHYDKIITPAIAAVIKAQKYSELMVSGKGVMFGRGETWINGICKPGSADCSEFEVRIVAIQAGGGSS